MEKPKLLPFRKEIINSIAQILEVEENQIFVKAKTGEKLGEIGNGLAVAVWATCLLYQNNYQTTDYCTYNNCTGYNTYQLPIHTDRI